jgi:tRNA G18 (ribose-2'-O)-methylase SpoU
MITRYLTSVQALALSDPQNSYECYKLPLFAEPKDINKLTKLQTLYVKTLSESVLDQIAATKIHQLALEEIKRKIQVKTDRLQDQEHCNIVLVEFTLIKISRKRSAFKVKGTAAKYCLMVNLTSEEPELT